MYNLEPDELKDIVELIITIIMNSPLNIPFIPDSTERLIYRECLEHIVKYLEEKEKLK
jgi:hypothetical protein